MANFSLFLIKKKKKKKNNNNNNTNWGHVFRPVTPT